MKDALKTEGGQLLAENVASIARWLHETYEKAATEKGGATQESTLVDFDALPQKNKETMWALTEKLQSKIERISKKSYDTYWFSGTFTVLEKSR